MEVDTNFERDQAGMKEKISALVDGEVSALERERVLRELRQDTALRGMWERYHLASTAMRRELDVVVGPGLADRIHDRLRHEHPDQDRGIGRILASRRTLKLAGGLAIAASVAAVAILNLPPVLSPAATTLAKHLPVRGDSPKTAVTDARQVLTEQQRVLNPYLVQHGEFTPAAGMNGMISYVRVVGRDSATTE